MKLNIVPARTGMTWVKLGMTTFFNQPLALAGLFFMFLAAIAVTGFVPILGTALGLALIPAASLGLMAATQEASRGRFPMPSVLLSAFRAGKSQARAMVVLGTMYALAFVTIAAATVPVDDGEFAKAYLLGGELTQDMMKGAEFQSAAMIFLLLYIPFACAFWHAPALVHWHGITPGKSVFFSLVACWRNKGAMVVFALTWMGVMAASFLLVLMLTGAIGGQQLAGVVMMPTTLLLASMFFVSMYFTFRDSFVGNDSQAKTEGISP